MMFGYDQLMNWYKTNFQLMQHHKYSLGDLEAMIPWERHLYIQFLQDYLAYEEERSREAAIKRRTDIKTQMAQIKKNSNRRR